MTRILPTQRKSPVLTPSGMACLDRAPAINLTAGCAHGCLYCYTQGHHAWPGNGCVRLYASTAAQLRDELARKRRKPAFVCFSSASDLFQPAEQVLDLTYQVLEILFRQGIGVAFLTKGEIPDRHMRLLAASAPLVRSQIGVTTLNERVLSIFEPRAATAEIRLRQMRRLVEAGIATQARLDPILPRLTDGPETLHPLFAAVAEAGVREAAASVLFLRPAVVAAMLRRQKRYAAIRQVLAAFLRRTWLKIHARRSAVIALPAAQRREIFDRVVATARQYGIDVHLCGCKNPDIVTGSCNIAGRWVPQARVEQLDLFTPGVRVAH